MKTLHPDYRFHRIWEITPEWLRQRGIEVLLLDVDNTLTNHNNPNVPPQVEGWISSMREAGVKLLILSNNKAGRVAPFAEGFGLGWVARAAKPLGHGVRRACRTLGTSQPQLAIIGDQIFTDVLCGRWAGITSILVDPMEQETFLFFRLKRWLERKVLQDWKGGDA